MEEIEIRFEEHHRALDARLREFCRETAAPVSEWEEERPDEAFAALVRALGASGLLAEVVVAPYGGSRERLDLRAICIARERLAAACGLADLAFTMQGLGSYPLQTAGTDALKRDWLPRVASGEAVPALALTEEFAGSDVASIATRAVEDGDSYVLDGEKWFISNAGVADFYCVFATVDPSLGRKGITCFFVEAAREGCSVARLMETLTPHPLGVVRFEGCRVPKSAVCGEVGGGFAVAMATLDQFRTSVGAAAVGMASRALEEAIAFARNREQFGRRIADFQLTQAAIAEMAVELDAARLLVYRAAWARDRGRDRVTVEASAAKLYATEAAQRIIDRSVQIHGGRGVLRGTITERLYRDVRALRIYEGTSEIQKLVIGSSLLRE